ncbi:MAG: hypothetical protein C6Y20_20215 [Tagaea sp. CACIAM 22H2]|nr:hypothetical protein [Tagaea sp. CACIAM 22H2]
MSSKRLTRRHAIAGAAGLAAATIWPSHRAAASGPVDLQLVLAADISRSIDPEEFALQRQGYATAIADPRVVKVMTGGRFRAVAATYYEWSGIRSQQTIVDWTRIDSAAAAEDFGAKLLAVPRPFGAQTALGEAIAFSLGEFRRCPFPAERRTLDVSGDGTNTSGMMPDIARDQVLAAGVTINALVILSADPMPWNPYHTHPPGGLDEYFRANVIGGQGAFLMAVQGFETFGFAMVNKLSRETA